jgi:carnosine N-methyltransferase
LHREWSKEGEAERITTFKVLVDELKLRLPVTAENAYLQRVLVPGCGLGRLPLEIAAAGYACQGNEYSA